MADSMMRDEFEAMLIELAWRDSGFRQRLVEDPRKAIEATFGQKILTDCEIVVIDESKGKVGIVIPVPPPAAVKGAALSDQDLMKVAGGATPVPQGNWRSLAAMPFRGLFPHSDVSLGKGKGGPL